MQGTESLCFYTHQADRLCDALTVYRYITTNKEPVREIFAKAYMAQGRIRIGAQPAGRGAIFIEILGNGEGLKKALRCALDLAEGTVYYAGQKVDGVKFLRLLLPEGIPDHELHALLLAYGMITA